MITLQDYKTLTQGNNPYLIKGFVNEVPTREQFVKQLSDNLTKGLIDKETHDKAIIQLDNLLKAKGEGSKGGHIIGHTKSGKAVYAGKKYSDYKDFTPSDHIDAAGLHKQKAAFHEKKKHETSIDLYGKSHSGLQAHHESEASSHEQEADRLVHEEHTKHLSTDEKKILADQKKKQISHHEKMHDHHQGLADLASIHADKHKGHEDEQHMRETADYHQTKATHHKQEKERLEKE